MTRPHPGGDRCALHRRLQPMTNAPRVLRGANSEPAAFAARCLHP